MKPHSGWRYGTPFLKRRCNPTVRSRNPPLEWLHETNLRFLRLRTPLGQQAKPCGILNVAGYYTSLLAMFDHAGEERFLKPENRGLVLARELPADLLQALERWRPPHVSILASLIRTRARPAESLDTFQILSCRSPAPAQSGSNFPGRCAPTSSIPGTGRTQDHV